MNNEYLNLLKQCLLVCIPLFLVACGNSSSQDGTTTDNGTQFVFDQGNDEAINGSGQTTTEQRNLSEFNKVIIEVGAVEINYCEHSATVTFDDNLVSAITTIVEEGVLTISSSRSFSSQSQLMIDLCVENLTEVSSLGASSILVNIPLVDINASVAGAGSIHLTDIQGETGHFSLEGAGKITAAGFLTEYQLSSTGASVFSGFSLDSNIANAHLQGSSKAEINTQLLNATLEGASNIFVNSDAVVEQNVTGTSTINKVDL